MPLFPSPEPSISCIDDLDFFKDFKNEFPAIVNNDVLTSKSDFSIEPTLCPQHINEFNLNDETSLSECDEKEQNVLYFNDLFSFNIIYLDDLKSDTNNDNDKIDIKQSSGDMSVIPLANVINMDVGAYACYSRINERQIQSKEGKIDSSKALDADLVVTEISDTKSEKHDTSSRSRNDTHAEDADTKPVNDKEPMVKVQLTAQNNVLANEKQHSAQSEPIYDTYLLEKVDSNITPDSTNMSHRGGEIDQNAKKYQISCPLLDPSFDNVTTKFSNQSLDNKAKIKKEIKVLETINIELEHSVAKLLAEDEKLHKENDHLKQTYKDLYDSIKKTRVQTKDFNDSLIAQVNSKTVEKVDLKASIKEKVFANVALKNELRKLKGNSVDTKFAKPSILGKSVLQPPRNQSIVRHPNANSSKESYGSNDMVHNYYLEEAKKKTQDKNRNFKPRKMPSARTHHTLNACTPKPRSNNQTFRNWPASKSSEKTLKAVQKADHSRNPKHRFSPNKSFAVHEKAKTHRSCLRWILTGGIFNTVGLRWVPTGKTFTSSTTKVDSEPPNGSNEDITNPYECEQTLIVSAGTLNISVGTPFNPKKERLRVWLLKKLMSKNQVPQGIHNHKQSPNRAQGIIFKCTKMIKRTAMASVDYTSGPAPIRKERFQEAAASRAEVLADSPVLISISQDAPSTRSSSNVIQIHTPFEHLGRWTKDHPIANVICNPSRSVSTRKQVETDAMWCYLDAFLGSVEPKNFKQAMTKPSWINSMQEEIHEFEILEDTDMSLTAYADADHARCQDTRCRTSGSAQFLGDKLVSWSSKKQKRTAISSTEAEYIALFGCCSQIL
nr:actin-binding, cofilin/tropomyosin type [Tanacetum cinerariifolium]